MAVQACNPRTQESEPEDCDFEASLGYICDLNSKNKNKINNNKIPTCMWKA
jgi:hypothetical protein